VEDKGLGEVVSWVLEEAAVCSGATTLLTTSMGLALLPLPALLSCPAAGTELEPDPSYMLPCPFNSSLAFCVYPEPGPTPDEADTKKMTTRATTASRT